MIIPPLIGVCPGCGRNFGTFPGAKEIGPVASSPGDLSLCVNCHHVIEYLGKELWRKITNHDWEALSFETKGELADIGFRIAEFEGVVAHVVVDFQESPEKIH